jgi:hypothetical protein
MIDANFFAAARVGTLLAALTFFLLILAAYLGRPRF